MNVEGENTLIYGEHGSGKSSIDQALKLLSQRHFKNFGKSKNIFAEDADVEVEFEFSNGRTFTCTVDTEEIPDLVNFLENLAVFVPMPDYKKLLKIHYLPDANGDLVNLYGLFRQLLRDYPVDKL